MKPPRRYARRVRGAPRDQQLSCLSSRHFRCGLPPRPMMHHRIENRQQLPHRRDQRDLGQFTGCAQTLIESPDAGVPARGHERGHIQGTTDGRAPTPDGPLPTPTNAVICLRFNVPNSGSSASTVRLITGPIPGTLRKRSSRARHTGLCSILSSRS